MFRYISGILTKLNQYPLAVNGYKDHVHILFEMTPTVTLSEVLQKVKANSSKWINENNLVPGKFSWQSGYGAFSYSKSQRNDVIQYIKNQEKHHKERTFRDEYLDLLKKFEIKFDDHYVFEFYE